MNITKFIPLSFNGACTSELFRPTINYKFTMAQIKLTRAWCRYATAANCHLRNLLLLLENKYLRVVSRAPTGTY